MPNSSASNRLIDPIVQVARHNRQEIDTLLANAGLARDALPPSAPRLESATLEKLLEQLARSTGNGRIALRVADATPPRALGPVGFLMATADTLAQALQCLADYLPLLIEGVQLRIERGREDCELNLEGACGDHLALWLLACLHSWSRQLTGTQIPPSRVEFSFETGADTAPYRQFFAAEVRFESPEARLVLPSRYLDRPCLDTNPEMHLLHRALADDLLGATAGDGALVPRVKGLIRRRLQEGHTDFGRRDLASALNLSLRTLQRKLDQQGTHFQALFDQCRQDLALQLLQRGHQSLGEISYQLGFSGLPAFQKAFRRWTGTSPGQYRQRQNARPAGGENRRLSDYIGPSGLPETLFYPLALQLLDLLPLRLAETPNVAAAPHRFSVLTPGPEQWQLKWVDAPATDALNELEYSAPETSGLVPPTPGPAALLYSLGCLYHALLHGRPPHSATDLRTLLRSRQERPPRFDGSLGKPLRALLAQLLQPSPGARPRSFEAVRQRLLHCRWQLQGTVTPAALHPDVPTDSAPDLGTAAVRERDRATLAELLLQAEAGQGRLLLVMGATGSGKSTLLYGLVDELLPAQAIRLRLRFQPQARGAASPVTDLLRQLIHQHSAAPAMEYGRWRRQLRQLPPESLRQLGALLPETATLEGLLGETQNATPNTEQHPGALFGALLRLSLSDRPVVICLDDLHFADTAALTTLNMLTGLLEDAGLLIIGSCRTEDRPVASPFARQWPLLRQQARCRLLELAPLQPAEIRQLLTGLIVASATDLDALALHLGRETAGNPGRLLQSLRALQPLGLVYDETAGRWRWDAPDPVPADSCHDGKDGDAVLERLPAASRASLHWAAVAGMAFDVEQLSRVCGEPLARLQAKLQPAQRAGIIHRNDAGGHRCRFSSARQREVLLLQLTDAERAHRHRIFGAFLRHAPDTAPDNRTLFERLHHLDQAQALDPVPGQNAELALLNFEAARRAEQAGALATARRYLQQGRNLARQTDAAELRQPTFETGLRLARLESTNGRHDIAAEILNESAGLARDPASRSALTLAWNQLLLQRGRPQEALDRLCSGLAEHGVEIPREPSAQAALALALTQQAMQRTGTGPDVAEGERTLLQRLWLNAELHGDQGLALCALAQAAQRNGHPDDSFACAALGYVGSWLGGDLARGEQLQRLALQLTAGETTTARARTLLLTGARLMPWTAPAATAVRTLEDAARLAAEAGDGDTAVLATLVGCHSRWMQGTPLSTLLPLAEAALDRGKDPACTVAGQALRASLRHLLDALGSPALATAAPVQDEPGAPCVDSPWLLLSRTLTAYLLEPPRAWPALLPEIEQALPRLDGYCAQAELTLLGALMRAELCRHSTGRRRQALLDRLQLDETRLELWSAQNPSTFACRAALLRGDRAALLEQPDLAERAYEAAIALSEESACLHIQAIACERYAGYWLRRGRPGVGRLLLNEARQLYERWQAPAKAAQLGAAFATTL